LLRQLAGGFRVVLDDEDAATTSRHGFAPTIATSLASLAGHAPVAIITMMHGG
jgi:hypothetical protein